MRKYFVPGLFASALALAAGPAAALDVYLAAKPFTKTMPDGSTVPMWGYALDTGDGAALAHCYDGADRAARLACVNALPEASAPGPRIKLAPGATTLRVFLTNGLPVRTSFMIQGQPRPFSRTDYGPTWDDGSVGARTSADQRVRSFGREANRLGGRNIYVWAASSSNAFERPGTFVYNSGTYPQQQVYMGLYGAVTKNAAAGEAYPGVLYDDEVVLFYSDIDPVINAAIDDGSYTTSIDYKARWFLVSGEPYVPGVTADIPVTAGNRTLLRLLSAASETHVPVLQGQHMTIHAEDGFQYTWQDGTTGIETPAPRRQYSAMLPALKTKDVVVVVQEPGRYAIYDGNGYMTNPSDPTNFSVGDTVGGMLRFLNAPAPVPLAAAEKPVQ